MKNILNIYKNFLLIRLTDEEIAKKYLEWKMRCPTHLSVGQEIVSACLQESFKNDDVAVSSHRAHAHYLGKGGNLGKMIAEIYGKETGCSKGKGGSMHLIDTKCNFLGSTAIVGNSIPIGVGHSLYFKINKKKNVSLIFFGDAGVETGVFYESLNFAILKNLPSIFVCENNFYSVYTPLKERQSTKINIANRISGLGIKTIRVDTSNWQKVLKTLKYSRDYVIKNKKPITITDKSMTRFLMTLDDAMNLVFFAFKNGKNGQTFVKKTNSSLIIEVAKALRNIFKVKNHPIKIIGIRHGEKIHETLMGAEERSISKENKEFFILNPDLRDLNYDKFYDSGRKLESVEDYNSSNTLQLDVESTIELLKKIDINLSE